MLTNCGVGTWGTLWKKPVQSPETTGVRFSFSYGCSPAPCPCPVPLPEAWVWASCRHHRCPQGQSEQTYSTVKTGMPAVTVTNLKPATRYVFQVRAASPGPSWETQSFSPSIEVQTPEEGKCQGSARGTWAGDRWERDYM